ncbi:MAG TPA: PP2C family serine/threonine-protein phosphatase [Streptosporangiaceae bacterium]|jgi:hypothetical protein|nr:PP2C family serine/threonine-protein phosphatase [Streptosporangiaceae bacterium]
MPGGSSEGKQTAVVQPGQQWELYSASAIGADHVRAGSPNQDAVGTSKFDLPAGGRLPVFAVADGHGHARHFRSDRGSRLAVAAATSVAERWAAGLPAPGIPTADAASQLVRDIVERWRELVAADLAADPITEVQAAAMLPDDPSEIPYGATLLLGVLTAQVAVLGQIGDGEMVLVLPDGRALEPVPGDSRLDGTKTTSICQPDAVSAFRVALVSLARTPVFAVLAATDGYGNAQADDNWRSTLAADLVRLGRERGARWIGSQVADWAGACASSDGSGDDCTIALALNSAVALVPPAPADRRTTLAAADQTLRYDQAAAHGATAATDRPTPATQPGRAEPPTSPVHAAAAPSLTRPAQFAGPAGGPGPGPGQGAQLPGGQPPRRDSRLRAWLAGAVVIVIAVAVSLYFLSHRSSDRPAIPNPSTTTMPTSRPSPTHSGSPSAKPSAGKSSPAKVNPSIPSGIPTTIPSGLPTSGSSDLIHAIGKAGQQEIPTVARDDD